MDTNSRIEEMLAGGTDRAKVGAWRRPGGYFGLLRSWRPLRTAAAGTAAGTAAALVVSLNGMTATGAGWWNVLIVTAGSLLTGLILGSYLGAPAGAEATACDVRWPVLGLTGLVIATSTGHGTLAAQLFTGAAPAVLAGVIQPAFAILSLALLGWALRERLGLERRALSPSGNVDTGDVCTACQPLFPSKPGPSDGAQA